METSVRFNQFITKKMLISWSLFEFDPFKKEKSTIDIQTHKIFFLSPVKKKKIQLILVAGSG